MKILIFFVSVFVAILFSLTFVILTIYFRKRQSTDIYRRMRRHNVTEKNLQRSKETIWQSLHRFIQYTSKPFVERIFVQSLDLKLKQAGIPLVCAEFVVANLIVMTLVSVLVYMLTINRVFAIIAALSIPLIVWFVMLIMIRRRKNSFTEQLGDCLVTFANALRAGYSFQQAMDIIAKEMESPISQEFTRVSNDIKMGVSLETALEQMNSRVNSTDLTLVITAVLIQREVGGNLAQILDTISDTISERIRMKREINALTAQGRLSSLVLLALPFAIGALTYMFNRSQMMMLFENPVGQMAVGISLIMDIVGFIVIHKIVSIDI